MDIIVSKRNFNYNASLYYRYLVAVVLLALVMWCGFSSGEHFVAYIFHRYLSGLLRLQICTLVCAELIFPNFSRKT